MATETAATAANAFGHRGPYQIRVLPATTAAGKYGAVYGVPEIRKVLSPDDNAFCGTHQILGVLRGAAFRGEIQQIDKGKYRNFTEGTLQQPADDKAAPLALIDIRPARATNAEVARRNAGITFSAKQRTIAQMVETVRATVACADGRQLLRNTKVKELRFPNLQVFEHYVAVLLDSQDGLCAITGIQLQLEGEHDDPELLCSLDRIDSNGHYEPGNLQIVCRFVNRWKNDSDDAEFRRLVEMLCR